MYYYVNIDNSMEFLKVPKILWVVKLILHN